MEEEITECNNSKQTEDDNAVAVDEPAKQDNDDEKLEVLEEDDNETGNQIEAVSESNDGDDYINLAIDGVDIDDNGELMTDDTCDEIGAEQHWQTEYASGSTCNLIELSSDDTLITDHNGDDINDQSDDASVGDDEDGTAENVAVTTDSEYEYEQTDTLRDQMEEENYEDYAQSEEEMEDDWTELLTEEKDADVVHHVEVAFEDDCDLVISGNDAEVEKEDATGFLGSETEVVTEGDENGARELVELVTAHQFEVEDGLTSNIEAALEDDDACAAVNATAMMKEDCSQETNQNIADALSDEEKVEEDKDVSAGSEEVTTAKEGSDMADNDKPKTADVEAKEGSEEVADRPLTKRQKRRLRKKRTELKWKLLNEAQRQAQMENSVEGGEPTTEEEGKGGSMEAERKTTEQGACEPQDEDVAMIQGEGLSTAEGGEEAATVEEVDKDVNDGAERPLTKRQKRRMRKKRTELKWKLFNEAQKLAQMIEQNAE